MRRTTSAAVGAMALLAAVFAIGCGGPEPSNVLIVTFDTTRADHIGCYGAQRSVTPNVDALAAAGVLFENAFAAVPITLPSHATLMTGAYPLAHGIRDNGLFVLADEQTTLAEILREQGYRTAAAIASYPLDSSFGLDQGFEVYDDDFTARYEDFRGRRVLPKSGIFFDERRAAEVNAAALPWLEEHHREAFFLWLHYFDPHQPLQPPTPYDQLHADDPYVGEIAYTDEIFGGVMRKLEELGVADSTIVVLAADHGEGLGDHGEDTHSLLAYGSTLHVPLIIAAPGITGGQLVSQRVGLVDVMPTVLDLLGIEGPAGMQGRSLREELEGRPRPPVTQYGETLSPRLSHGLGELRVLYDGDAKYIHGPRPELFDLAADPEELDNLADVQPDLAAIMHRKLERFLDERAATEPQQVGSVDDESRMRLEALGYIQSSADSGDPIREELRSGGQAPQDRVGDVNLMSMAKNLIFKKQGMAAREASLELLRRQPGDPMALEMAAAACLQIGLIDEALEHVLQLRSLYPEGTQMSGKLMMQLGALHLYKGEFATALEMLEAAQENEPSAEGQYLISLTHLSIGDRAAEAAPLEAALEIDSSYAPARVALGVHHARAGRAEAAEAEFRRAITDQPFFGRAHFNYGAFLVEQERYPEAIDRFERAVEVAPEYPQPYLALVAVNVELGYRERARLWNERLQERAPASPEAEKAALIMEDG